MSIEAAKDVTMGHLMSGKFTSTVSLYFGCMILLLLLLWFWGLIKFLSVCCPVLLVAVMACHEFIIKVVKEIFT